MIRLTALVSLLTLAACAETQQAVDTAGRQQAKRAVIEVVATNYPQVTRATLEPVTDCIVERAFAAEVRQLAQAAVVGPGPADAQLVDTIYNRPDTQNCIVRKGAAAPAA